MKYVFNNQKQKKHINKMDPRVADFLALAFPLIGW